MTMSPTTPTLDELVDAVLARLREEIRTRRLVVVDDQGRERINTRHYDDGTIELEVLSPAHAEGSADCRVVLTACDGEWIRDAGLYVSAGGQMVAQIEGVCDVHGTAPTVKGPDRAPAHGRTMLHDYPADSNTPLGQVKVAPAGIVWKAPE